MSDMMPRDRSQATVHERTAWMHDIGEHDGADYPYAYCHRCEIEHPRGVLAQVRARLNSAGARVRDLEEALEFYASSSTYTEAAPPPGELDGPVPIKLDKGYRARRALDAGQE